MPMNEKDMSWHAIFHNIINLISMHDLRSADDALGMVYGESHMSHAKCKNAAANEPKIEIISI